MKNKKPFHFTSQAKTYTRWSTKYQQPSHLLYTRLLPLAPQVTATDVRDPLYQEESILRLNYQRSTDLLQKFTEKWIQDYLCTLRERHVYYNKQESRRPQVGDLVLLLSEEQPREEYPLGVILETYAGEDGVIRTVKVRTRTGTFTRPIVKVIPLEVQVITSYFSDAPEERTDMDGGQMNADVPPPSEEWRGPPDDQPSTSQGHRPQRAATRAALDKIQGWLD